MRKLTTLTQHSPPRIPGDPRSFGDQFRRARLARAGSSGHSSSGSRGAILLSGEKKDWFLRRCALGGLDTLVFAGGIGENAPLVRARICDGLGFLGIELGESRNAETAGVTSTVASWVTVRVIRTDEDLMIARSVCRILETDAVNEED